MTDNEIIQKYKNETKHQLADMIARSSAYDGYYSVRELERLPKIELCNLYEQMLDAERDMY